LIVVWAVEELLMFFRLQFINGKRT